jgi:hypothetical protein
MKKPTKNQIETFLDFVDSYLDDVEENSCCDTAKYRKVLEYLQAKRW